MGFYWFFLVDLSRIKLTDITLNQYHISNLDILTSNDPFVDSTDDII